MKSDELNSQPAEHIQNRGNLHLACFQILKINIFQLETLANSENPDETGDNPQASASGLSYIQVDNHGFIPTTSV